MIWAGLSTSFCPLHAICLEELFVQADTRSCSRQDSLIGHQPQSCSRRALLPQSTIAVEHCCCRALLPQSSSRRAPLLQSTIAAEHCCCRALLPPSTIAAEHYCCRALLQQSTVAAEHYCRQALLPQSTIAVEHYCSRALLLRSTIAAKYYCCRALLLQSTIAAKHYCCRALLLQSTIAAEQQQQSTIAAKHWPHSSSYRALLPPSTGHKAAAMEHCRCREQDVQALLGGGQDAQASTYWREYTEACIGQGALLQGQCA